MRNWNWADRVALPAALLIAEATWVTLAIDASLLHLHVSVAYLDVVLPGLALIALGALATRFELTRRVRAATVVASVLVVASASSGVIDLRLTHSSFVAAAFTPWAVHGTRATAYVVVAWSVSFASCVRGISLRARSISVHHAAVSAAFGAGAFVLLFILDAVDHEPAVQRAFGAALISVAVFLVCSASALVVTRRREIERASRHRAANRVTSLRDGVVLASIGGVTAVLVLVTLVLGVIAPLIGRGTEDALSFLRSLWLSAPRQKVQKGFGHSVNCLPRCKTHPPSTHIGFSNLGSNLGPIIITLLALCILGIYVRHRRHRRGRRDVDPESAEDEAEVDSLFSWRHLLAQLWAWLHGLFVRKRHLAGGVPLPVVRTDLESVRSQYRRFLTVAARSGRERHTEETAGEFAQRIGSSMPTLAQADIDESTNIYELVRYGGNSESEHLEAIRDRVDHIVQAFELLDAEAQDVRSSCGYRR